MDDEKRRKLESAGWKVGDAREFLELSDEEVEYIEVKISLSRAVRSLRKQHAMTQEQLANLVTSSQSRVAKMEAGDPTVSLDLLIKTLIAMGYSRQELAEAIEFENIEAA